MFLHNYERVIFEDELDKLPKKFLSDESYTSNKICRFCGKSELETSFDKSSHSISAMVGNVRLFSLYECKSCNCHFGSSCEDAFGKYILPLKIVSEIYTRDKSSLSYKQPFGEIRMKKNEPILPQFDNHIKILIKESEEGSILKLKENGAVLTVQRQKHTPEMVYFSLLKMAISIMPYDLLHRFVLRRAHLSAIASNQIPDDERENILQFSPTYGFLEFIPGPRVFKSVSAELFLRKSDVSSEYVLCHFCLNFGHFSLQLALPEDSQSGVLNTCGYLHFSDSKISNIDFHSYEKEFCCELAAEMHLLLEEDIQRLQNSLNSPPSTSKTC